MFERRGDQPCLLVLQSRAFLALEPDQIGHVGLQHHGAVAGGASFRDLKPEILGQAHVEHGVVLAVARLAFQRPGQPGFALRQGEIGGPADKIDIIVEPQPRGELIGDVAHVLAEPAVGQHQPVLAVEERKALVHRLDRVGKVGPGRLGLGAGLFQLQVAVVQEVERTLQIAGARAHLILEQGGALELGIGQPRGILLLLHPAHQRLGDPQELFVLALDTVGGVDQRHSASSGG